MNDKQRSGGRVRKQKLHQVKLLYVQRGRQVRNIQTLPILAIEVDCKRKKSDHRRCARHNGRVREDPGRQQPCWGSLFYTNLTQPTGSVQLVQHYPKTTPAIFWSLSILISLMTERQSVRFSSRVKVS